MIAKPKKNGKQCEHLREVEGNLFLKQGVVCPDYILEFAKRPGGTITKCEHAEMRDGKITCTKVKL